MGNVAQVEKKPGQMNRRRFIAMAGLAGGAVLVAGATKLITDQPNPTTSRIRPYNGMLGPLLTISKTLYYEKTLACILGQIAGVLTAYEFTSTSPVPDDWFDPMNGPYAGNFSNWSPPSTEHYVIYQGPGKISSNDDWHIDFFNQLILSEHGINPTFQDIKDEWQAHQVSDWGGGFETMRLIKDEDMLPPLTGLGEFNRWYWVTEAFIETETLGCVAPGMPATTRDLNEKFAQVVAEWEAVWWARFLATMYSFAYFETDARIAMEKASVTLPRNSWNWQIYQKAKDLHQQNSTDWRWAQSQMFSFRRSLAQTDNAMVNPDLLNGDTIISILYGNNDYNTTFKISSLIGNEAIDTASAALGLLGIIKGMDGTPQIVKDRIYADGAGIMINDFNRDPHIGKDYPKEQKFSDLVKLYQSNAEKIILAKGGSIDATNYYINGQDVKPEQVVIIPNADFEQGDLSGWQVWTPVPDDKANPHVYAGNNGTAHSGDYHGAIQTDDSINEAKLYVNLNNLENGATYRAYAFLQSEQEARLFVDSYGGPYIYTNVVETINSPHREWVSRNLEFTVVGTTASVGLHVPGGDKGSASLDNLYVQKITNPDKIRYEATKAILTSGAIHSAATASSGSYVGDLNSIGSAVRFQVKVAEAGEYRMAVNYANGGNAPAKLNLYVNDVKKAAVTFPRTKKGGVFSRNIVPVPVVLKAGDNSITLQKDLDGDSIDLDHIEISTYPGWVY